MYETGEREPNFETLEAIADYFNVDMNTLVGGSPPAAAEVVSLPAREIDAIYDALNAPGQKELCSYGRYLCSVEEYKAKEPPKRGTPTKVVPLLGEIACGEPILAEENIEEYVDLPEHIKADFALRCRGDSMINARIFDGDVVYIRQQPDVADGEIAAVLIDQEATLKRVYHYPDRLELRPENPTFPVQSYEGPQLSTVRILGKAVAFTSPVR